MYERYEGTGSCNEEICNPGCKSRSCGDAQVDYAIMLSHWAKAELLKEKIKQRMDSHYGKNLDKIADLIVEVIADKTKTRTSIQKKRQEIQEAFTELQSGESS